MCIKGITQEDINRAEGQGNKIMINDKSCDVPIFIVEDINRDASTRIFTQKGCASDGRDDRIYYGLWYYCPDGLDRSLLFPGDPIPGGFISLEVGSGNDYIIGSEYPEIKKSLLFTAD